MLKKLLLTAALLIIVVSLWFSKATPQTDEEILDKARQLRDNGVWSQSITEYENYIVRNPRNQVIRKEIGTIYGWNMDWKNAQRELEKYIESVPTDVEALEVLGDVYLYDNQYKKALDTYNKAIAADPSIEPKLKDKMREAKLGTRPYLEYDFYYYREKNKKTDERLTSLTHEWAWNQPIKDNLYLVSSYGFRIDDTLHKITPIYGAGFKSKVFEKSWLDVRLRFEKDRGINPRYDLRAYFLTIPAEDYELTAVEDITWYWDGNTSYATDLDLARAFLKDKSLKAHIGFSYDNIKKPSPYFDRIETGGKEGKHLDLYTGLFTLEKFFYLTKKVTLTLGGTASINTDETKTLIGLTALSYKFNDYINLYLSVSYGLDTDHYEYRSAGAYLNVLF